jgi:hypothetical protein
MYREKILEMLPKISPDEVRLKSSRSDTKGRNCGVSLLSMTPLAAGRMMPLFHEVNYPPLRA